MKKFILVTIVNTKSQEHPIYIFFAPIRCNENDEASIKQSIESQKNDPNVLIAIITRDIEETSLARVKPFLDQLKKLIKECTSLVVSFVDASEIGRIQQSCQKNNISYAFSKN